MNGVKRLFSHALLIYIIVIAVCLLGLVSLTSIDIAPFPVVKTGRLNVLLSYPGASGQVVQTQVTDKVEQALQSVDNIEYVQANSFAGMAYLMLTLDSNKASDVLKTKMDVTQAISSAGLPSIVPSPMISQSAMSSSLVTYVLTSKHLSAFALNNLVQSRLVPQFRGISSVSVFADSLDPELHIRLLPKKLAQYQLDIGTLSGRLNSAFTAQPLGNLSIGHQEYPLSLGGRIQQMSDFNQVIVGVRHLQKKMAGPILLKDIAHVDFSPANITPSFYNSYNGVMSDSVYLYTQGLANPFKVYGRAQAIIKQVKASLPADVKITLFDNQAKTMHHSFVEVLSTIAVASALVLLIALAFLGRLRLTWVPITTIPVCLLGTIAVLNVFGFSLNILTLLAMVVAVGLVVDDAIVVVENISRYLDQGFSVTKAIVEGTSDIALTVLGITGTLLAVYLPICFLDGPIIDMFKAFAVPLAAAVFISGLAALTLTPLLCMLLMKDNKPNSYQLWFHKKLDRVIAIYHSMLSLVLKGRWFSVSVIVVLVIVGFYIDSAIPRAVFPEDPSGRININMSGGPNDTIQTLEKKMQVFAPFYKQATVKNYSTVVHRSAFMGYQISANLIIQYKDQYLKHNQQYADAINAFILKNKIKRSNASVQNVSNWGEESGLDVMVYGTGSVASVHAKVKALETDMKRSPIFSQAFAALMPPSKGLSFDIDSVLAARFALYRADISSALAAYFGGFHLANNITIDGLSVPVVLQLDHQSQTDPQSIQSLPIYSPVAQAYYPLSKFVHLRMVRVPSMIQTFNGHPSVNIHAELAKGATMGNAIATINHLMATKAPSLSYQYTGSAAQYLQGNMQTIFVVLLGSLTIYFMLAILFNSLLDPLIILLTVPFSVISGALSLNFFGDTLNIYSCLALITLIGLITKHGVLIVRFANDALLQGQSVREAVMLATQHRFRPIMMTTLAMMLGALPLVFSQDLMYMARRDLGLVLVVGLFVGTFFSLFVVPLAYTLLKKSKSA